MTSPVTLTEWLRQVGLARLESTFRHNGIDLDILLSLTDGDLRELGLTLGDRKRVLTAAAQASRSNSSPAWPASGMGAAAREESERRQLTMMFCDLVGSTSLSNQLDLEDMHAVVQAYQNACGRIIARYEGFVANFMGDGILAYFGYPRAHEDDAARAVRAGLEIGPAIAKLETGVDVELQVRVGIATGVVVVDALGKGSALGDTPNLAARLQTLARPGSVVISRSTRRLLGEQFSLHSVGLHSLKGFNEPIEAWSVEGLSSSQSASQRSPEETPLVGREQELAFLLERWGSAKGGAGQVVLLSGEPGIGKSRLVRALRGKLETLEAQALRHQCSPYYANSAFWPSIDFIERTLQFGRNESPDTKLDKLEDLMVNRHGRPLADVRFVASLLSIPCEQRYGALVMTPQKEKEETLRVLVDLCEAAARRLPALVVFEDMHWADPTTLEVLDLLIERTANAPLLLVLTYRPEFQPRWPEQAHVGQLMLNRLEPSESAALVLRLTSGKALPGDLAQQILTKTDGVPLFVEEFTRSILESGGLKETGDRYEFAGANHRITLPATLRDLLTARLDRQSEAKEIAQIGAAIGRKFSYELIAAAARLTAVRLDAGLERLVDSGLAYRQGTAAQAVYQFKHALVRDAAYESLLKSRRQELHRRIAEAIEDRFPALAQSEPETLAHHHTQAGQPESAIPLWQKAGELAFRRMALAESISHLATGLEVVATLPPSRQRDESELALRIPLGRAWQALEGWANRGVWNSLHPALALAKSLGRTDELLPILWGLALNVLTQGRIAQSLPWVKETLDTADATGDPDLLITAEVLANAYHYFMGEPAEALVHHRKALALYDEHRHRRLLDLLNHDPKTRVGVYSAICLWMMGYPDQAVRLSEQTVAHARRLGHVFDLGFALRMEAELFDFRGEPERMRSCAEECDRLGRDNSLPVLWALIARFAAGVALIRENKAAEGVGPLGDGLRFWDAAGGGSHGPYLKAVLAEGKALLGEFDAALALIDEQIVQIERPGWEERVYYAEILRLKGWMLSHKGDLDGAERYYLASLDWARRQAAKSWELRTATSLARLRRAQGRSAEGYDLLAPVHGWFTEGFDTRDLREAKALIETLAGHRGEDRNR